MHRPSRPAIINLMDEKSHVDRPITLTDPRTIRAVAHPARLTILEALQGGREMTATECASLTGLSPNATNYHLKALARYGLVGEAPPRSDARERPWRALGRGLDIRSDLKAGKDLADRTIMMTFWDRDRAVIDEFLARQEEEPPSWRDVVLSNGDYWITADEAHQIAEAVEQVLEPYRARGRAERPDGSRRVRIAYLVVPRRDPNP